MAESLLSTTAKKIWVIIGRECKDPKCDHPPWSRTYDLAVKCNNCGEEHIAYYTKGHTPEMRKERCPHCEVEGRLQYGTWQRARAMLVEKAVFVYMEWDGDEFVERGRK